ncbi:hypothetical protein [Perlucidibaca piscinae]|uniref:hypothetical protein n=1 Tax=Perlucidibaca piscinae TaxID=392589 RepID=UPI0012EB8457|nr:hypothetical protein [Perlucidibaca piscinae]
MNIEKAEDLKNESNRTFGIYEKKKEAIEKVMYSYYECIDHVDKNFDSATSRFALIPEDTIRAYEKALASNFLFIDEFSWKCTKFSVALLRNNSARLLNKNPITRKEFYIHDLVALNYLYTELQKYFRKNLSLSTEEADIRKVLAIFLYTEYSGIKKYCKLKDLVKIEYCETGIDELIKKIDTSASEVKSDIDSIIAEIENSGSQILLLSIDNFKYLKELAVKAL